MSTDGKGPATGEGAPQTPDGRSTRRVLLDPDGPVLVEGPVEVTLPDGRTERCERFMVALCTCRRSHTYPWCDTSHRSRTRRTRPGDGTDGSTSNPQ